MNDDLERWINLEGPPPQGVCELLDAACDVPEMTAEQEARLDQRLHAALAEDRRRRARLRALKRGLVAAGVAGAVVIAFRLAAPPELELARRMPSDVSRPETEQIVGAESPVLPAAPAMSATSEPPDAVCVPGRRSESEHPQPPPRLRRVRPPQRDPGGSLDR